MEHQDVSNTLFAFTAMAGIFPDAPDIDTFWRKIRHAEVAPLVPLEKRWGLDRSVYFDPEPGKPGYIYLDQAFCLPELLHLRGRQIAYGQKVLKDLCSRLRAEDKQPAPEKTGLVVASCWNDQEYYQGDIDLIFNKYRTTLPASGKFLFSPREKLEYIAQSANLGGPRLAVDTACASSVYGIIDAIGLITGGQADAVVVLGLNVSVPPFLMGIMSQVTALSASGKSLPFSDQASGMVPGESACAVLVEPLDRAIQSSRTVLGVLRAAGLSADGSEGSVFGPGVKGQLLSYQRAYEHIDPGAIDYIEAHGTATILGDATEIETLDYFFRDTLPPGGKLPVGSIKSLVGHTIAAAGMVSLIKALLMIRENTIPPHIPVTPHPGLENSCLCLPQAPGPFQANGRPVRIGVSSFGLGGSNSHMVVEAIDSQGRKPTSSITRLPEKTFEKIAVIDMEAAFGNIIGADNWRACLEKENYPYTVFPENRFFKPFQNIPKGLFFPDTITIDAGRFRTGPKLIPYVDTFQNLGTCLVARILERHPSVSGSGDTGIALCANSGGAKGFQLSRRFLLNCLTRMKQGHSLDHPESDDTIHLKIEELSSTLASMFSGFPAFHFNLRGFHQTLSGDTDTFWHMFRTAPYLLGHHCRHLLIGGGSYVKTPLDLCYPGLSGEENNTCIVEGIGIFLLKTLTAAIEDGDQCLGVITSIIPGDQAADFNQACQRAGIRPRDVDIRETCRLTPGASGWFLYEAGGIDTLAAALLKKGRHAAITVFSGSDLVLTLFIEKQAQWRKSQSRMTAPLELSFTDNTALEKRDETHPFGANDSSARHTAPKNRDEESVQLWHETTLTAMNRYFQVQKEIAGKLSGTPHNRPPRDNRNKVLEDLLRGIKKNNADIVITRPDVDNASAAYSALLVVDESNTYFFDHPLDHVPGILLLEAALQLFDLALAHTAGSPGAREYHTVQADITFHHWCEKDIPVRLEATLKNTSDSERTACRCRFRQGNKVVCSATLTACRITEEFRMPQERRNPYAVPVRDIKVLHKQFKGNVMVTNISLDPDNPDNYVCDALPPPDGHLLNDGNDLFHSMVYLLEASRQCSTLCAHTTQHTSYDSKMTLLTIRMLLSRPLHKEEAVKIKRNKPRPLRFGDRYVSENDFSFIGSGNEIGTCRIIALTEDEQSYEMSRWKN